MSRKFSKLMAIISIITIFTSSNYIFSKHIYVTNKSDFEQRVLNNNLPAVVKFSASWCNPCKRIKTIIDQVASKYSKKVNFVEVNFDDLPELSSKYNIRSLPTVLFLDGPPSNKKEVVSRQIGANLSKNDLINKIEKAFKL